MAKLMKKRADQIGVEMTLTFAQHTIARLHGYRDWKDLVSVIGQGIPHQQRQPALLEEAALERLYVQRLSLLLEIETDVSRDLFDSFRQLTAVAQRRADFRPELRTDDAPSEPRLVVVTLRKKVLHAAPGKRLIDLTGRGREP